MVRRPDDHLDDLPGKSELELSDGELVNISGWVHEQLALIWPEQCALLYWNSGLDLLHEKC